MALRCPLLMAACIVRNGDALHAEADCAEDKCMWWSEEHGDCFIPAFLNEILVDGAPMRVAVAVVCDKCVESERIPARAVEFRFGESGRAEIVYHEVTDLEDVFEITPDMLLG